MSPGRLRAGVVIALIVVCSALAGAAVERLVFERSVGRRPGGGGPGGPGRGSPEQDGRRRNDMLDRMTKQLDLSATQRAGIDSVMKRTDSSLRAISCRIATPITSMSLISNFFMTRPPIKLGDLTIVSNICAITYDAMYKDRRGYKPEQGVPRRQNNHCQW